MKMPSPDRPAAPIRQKTALKEFEVTDARIRTMALALGARDVAYPALIARDVLRAAEYDRAFPHLLMAGTAAANPDVATDDLFRSDNLHAPRWFLSPAVCYHTYAQFAGRTLARPVMVTARGKCFRNEDRKLSFGRRQIEFEMREIILLGPREWIEERLPGLQRQVEVVAAQLGLAGQWKTAEDPFFLPRAQGKALLQRLLETKREYCLRDSDALAITSVNRHCTFFGERFRISNRDHSPVHSACVAFGLDRWTAARTAHERPPLPALSPAASGERVADLLRFSSAMREPRSGNAHLQPKDNS